MMILSCFLLLEHLAISILEESHGNNCIKFVVVVVVISKKGKVVALYILTPYYEVSKYHT
jgi:hypothetical protein